MEIQTENGLQEALSYIESGNPAKARAITRKLFERELECPELMYTTMCCTFWEATIQNLDEHENPYERGEILLSEWKTFLTYIAEQKEYKPAFFAVQKGIFTLALRNYKTLVDTATGVQKSELYRKAGLCSKKLGLFEEACAYLAEANAALPCQAAVLAELADCYSLCGNDRNAKALFREAFFIGSEKIDLVFLDSSLIRNLISKISEKLSLDGEPTPQIISEWIPVYGTLWGIFNIKRSLNSQEVGKLKQDIYAMENEIKNPASNKDILEPRLLKNYFWLIDHYVSTNASQNQINEILLKIKILNLSIYDMYIK